MTDEQLMEASQAAFIELASTGCAVRPVNMQGHETYALTRLSDEQPMFIFLTEEMAKEVTASIDAKKLN